MRLRSGRLPLPKPDSGAAVLGDELEAGCLERRDPRPASAGIRFASSASIIAARPLRPVEPAARGIWHGRPLMKAGVHRIGQSSFPQDRGDNSPP
jgi:hypothetical protein